MPFPSWRWRKHRVRIAPWPSLLDLTSQGDVATITDDAYLNRTLQLMDPQQLYELWERQHWQSQAIDLERDKEQWAELTDEQKEEHLWGLSSFFVGEERVTTQFSGLVMAYEDEQEEAFLTTQQVDEARHMQFFDRWFREVAGIDGGIQERLAASRADVTDAFVELFDERLVKMGERLIADPSDMDAKVDFITNYHMVIEGTLALTGQHFMLDYYENNDLLPGFAEGFENIARDEHRHVAYGTWFLQQKCGEERYRTACRRRSTTCCRSPPACSCRRATSSATSTSSSATPRRSRPSSPTARSRGG